MVMLATQVQAADAAKPDRPAKRAAHNHRRARHEARIAELTTAVGWVYHAIALELHTREASTTGDLTAAADFGSYLAGHVVILDALDKAIRSECALLENA